MIDRKADLLDKDFTSMFFDRRRASTIRIMYCSCSIRPLRRFVAERIIRVRAAGIFSDACVAIGTQASVRSR